MTTRDFAVSLVAALDDETLRALADRLRPHLAADSPDRPLLTPAQAAERLRLHPKTVVRMARDGRLPAAKIGGGWRFSSNQLDISPSARSPRSVVTSPGVRRAEPERASVRAIRGESSMRAGRADR